MSTLIILVLILIFCVLVFFLIKALIYKLAADKKLFATIPTDEIALIAIGSDGDSSAISKMIANSQDWFISRNDLVEKRPRKKRIKDYFWIGFFGKILEFEIDYGKFGKDGIFKTGTRKISYLRIFFPTSVEVKGAECENGVKVNITLTLLVRVIDPKKLMVHFKGRYYEQIAEVMKSVFEDVAVKYEAGFLIALDKGVLADAIEKNAAAKLKDAVGLELLRLTQNGIEYSDPRYQSAVEARELARVNQDKEITDAQTVALTAEYRAKAEETIQKAKVQDIIAVVAQIFDRFRDEEIFRNRPESLMAIIVAALRATGYSELGGINLLNLGDGNGSGAGGKRRKGGRN